MSVSFEQCFHRQQPTDCVQQCTVSRSASICSSQTVASSCFIESTSDDLKVTSGQLCKQTYKQNEDSESFSTCDCEVSAPQAEQLWGWLGITGRASTYMTCVEMIRRHKRNERTAALQTPAHITSGSSAGNSATAGASGPAAAVVDGGSRMVVVSWLVEVAEEFGLQQESLHTAVALLDSFLASAAGVPRCVLQLVAVGFVFIATKQLEVHAPSVEALVSVAAHSFSAADLLRVERLLLDALDFKTAPPTAYGCLHLLTQATLAAMSMATTSQQQQQPAAHPAAAAACCGPCPPMERVVSLAMYLTELALMDTACCALPGSSLATAALMLAHTTLAGHCGAAQLLLTAAGMSAQQVQPAVVALRALHAAAAAPASAQLGELLLPLKAKFGQDCWCRVAAEVTPLDMQQQQQATIA